jgi:hypothetical protein
MGKPGREDVFSVTPSQLGIIFGTRLGLLVCAIVLFTVGATVPIGVGQYLVLVSFLVAALYLYVYFRTRSRLKRSLSNARGRDPRRYAEDQ